MRVKEIIGYRNFFHKQEEKRPFNNLTMKLADGESFLVNV